MGTRRGARGWGSSSAERRPSCRRRSGGGTAGTAAWRRGRPRACVRGTRGRSRGRSGGAAASAHPRRTVRCTASSTALASRPAPAGSGRRGALGREVAGRKRQGDGRRVDLGVGVGVWGGRRARSVGFSERNGRGVGGDAVGAWASGRDDKQARRVAPCFLLCSSPRSAGPLTFLRAALPRVFDGACE